MRVGSWQRCGRANVAGLQLLHPPQKLVEPVRAVRISFASVREAPAAFGTIKHRPDPQERPKRMKREQTDPARRMDRILMRMVAVLCDLVGHVVDRDDPVEQGDHDENEQPERKVV